MIDAKVTQSVSQIKGTKAGLQRFGGFLSSMVIPNIGAFIAWGLLTALFIPTGWTPSTALGNLVSPMITYLLPLLIGYTGGNLIHGKRGAVVGAIATMGVIIGSSVPMFLGAMLMGPFSAYVVKKFDALLEGKIRVGFEMLVDTFSAGIIGGLLAVLGYLAIGPAIGGLATALGAAALFIVQVKLLPLIAILVEPGKILFLNNAINHGIFDPVGISQVKAYGKSIFFLLETDPGPGLGVLLAYWIFGKGTAKSSAPGAIIIHFFGGIHEIYFPFVLMNPLLLLSVIFGGMAADLVFVLTGAGLVASPSPGSIIAEIVMSPKGGLLSVLTGITVGAIVSFLISMVIVKRSSAKEDEGDSFEAARETVARMKAESKGGAAKVDSDTAVTVDSIPSVIVFACDAGMGSSAMGETILKKKLKEAGLDIKVNHAPISEIPQDAEVVFTQESLAERARRVVPNAQVISVGNFLDGTSYDQYISALKEKLVQQR
ncbi:MAG TPA: PTS mannitol transporter subunit IICB [Nitrospira sp.]